MDSPAILDKDGNLHLPNGSSASGTTTPSATKAQNTVPLPSRGDAQGKGSSVGTGTFGVKVGLAQMLKGGVIMDVMNAEQAKIAEEAGAVAVMALEVSPRREEADERSAANIRQNDEHSEWARRSARSAASVSFQWSESIMGLA